MKIQPEKKESLLTVDKDILWKIKSDKRQNLKVLGYFKLCKMFVIFYRFSFSSLTSFFSIEKPVIHKVRLFISTFII